ncbi:MAG: adenylyl-sulfate kinase [Thermoplasmata archaeon]|nr:adenylyl-sulfate kinase [Thermoplasmata archaeon]
MTWCAWVTGLPGAGKSAVVDHIRRLLAERGVRPELLRLDDIRRRVAPDPEYTAEERERVYGALAAMAIASVVSGRPVVVDATAHRRAWRASVEDDVDRYIEVFVDAPLEVCMAREAARPGGKVMADIYRKALERRDRGVEHEGLGEVVGIDVTYERSPDAFVLDAVGHGPEENARSVVEELDRRGWLG